MFDPVALFVESGAGGIAVMVALLASAPISLAAVTGFGGRRASAWLGLLSVAYVFTLGVDPSMVPKLVAGPAVGGFALAIDGQVGVAKDLASVAPLLRELKQFHPQSEVALLRYSPAWSVTEFVRFAAAVASVPPGSTGGEPHSLFPFQYLQIEPVLVLDRNDERSR